jgi:hypothetical protein
MLDFTLYVFSLYSFPTFSSHVLSVLSNKIRSSIVQILIPITAIGENSFFPIQRIRAWKYFPVHWSLFPWCLSYISSPSLWIQCTHIYIIKHMLLKKKKKITKPTQTYSQLFPSSKPIPVTCALHIPT